MTIVYVDMRVHYMLYPVIIVMIVRNWILKAAFVLTFRKWPTVLDYLNFHILILMKALAKLFTDLHPDIKWNCYEKCTRYTFCAVINPRFANSFSQVWQKNITLKHPYLLTFQNLLHNLISTFLKTGSWKFLCPT